MRLQRTSITVHRGHIDSHGALILYAGDLNARGTRKSDIDAHYLYGNKTSTHAHYSAHLNPLPPSDAVWKQKKYILEDLFSSVLSEFKNNTSLET